jgi:hypothetical protein
MAGVEHKNLSSPDETRTFGHGKAEIISIGGGSVGRLTLERGWKWSQDVKPIAKTQWCEAPHFHYQVSGRLHVVMQAGESSRVSPVMSSWFLQDMMLGSLGMNLSCSSTGMVQRIMQNSKPFQTYPYVTHSSPLIRWRHTASSITPM